MSRPILTPYHSPGPHRIPVRTRKQAMVIIVIAVVAVSAFVSYLAYLNAHPTIIEEIVGGAVTVRAGSSNNYPFFIADSATTARVVANCKSVKSFTVHPIYMGISRLGGDSLYRGRCDRSLNDPNEQSGFGFNLPLRPGSSYLLSITAGCAPQIMTWPPGSNANGQSASPPGDCDNGSERVNVSAILTYTK